MASDALCKRQRYIVFGFQPVDKGMSEHMASKIQRAHDLVERC